MLAAGTESRQKNAFLLSLFMCWGPAGIPWYGVRKKHTPGCGVCLLLRKGERADSDGQNS